MLRSNGFAAQSYLTSKEITAICPQQSQKPGSEGVLPTLSLQPVLPSPKHTREHTHTHVKVDFKSSEKEHGKRDLSRPAWGRTQVRKGAGEALKMAQG